MKRQRFKRSIAWTPYCRCLLAAPNATGSSITGMARCRCTRHWTLRRGACTEKTAARHTGADFVDFLGEVVSQCRPKQEIHIILDNLSAHKTQAVRDFLDTHPKVRLHFTPTYSSWLNQVELWFAKFERDVIARGVFTSVLDLARKLRRYINAYSANAQPSRWKYSDVTRRIRSNDLVATGHY
jgi:hypothetical protein